MQSLMGEFMAPFLPFAAGVAEYKISNDDMVLGINITVDPDTGLIDHSAPVDSYAVVVGSIVGVDAQLNATNTDRNYIHEGTSSSKTATQRTFKVTGDRDTGSHFQEYALSHGIKYGVGSKVITDYVWFDVYRGKGEKGQVSIIVNSDGSGNAGADAAIDIDLRKVGAMPSEYQYVRTEPAAAPLAATVAAKAPIVKTEKGE